ncbi:MAG: prolipoprotein diacylglyceryl transferase [Bryobacterales bacterium]|nr:prolipoprotein diacylglyceryl transferase [Bryobacterales bacterium]
MLPQLVRIGDFFLPTYGLLVTAGFLIALWLATRLAAKSGLNKEAVFNLGIYCGLAGILGAKLLLILVDFRYYVRNPGEIFSFSTFQAGGIFYGGLLAALATAYLYMRHKRLPVLATADAFAPGLALGHAVGRVGCFAAGCCWGLECHRPWAVTFRNPVANQLFGTPLNVPLHPTQIYEAAAEALTFGILYARFHRPHKAGGVIGLYLSLYAVARFVIEFFRAPESPNPFGGPFTTAQWISIGLFVLGAVVLTRRPKAAGR